MNEALRAQLARAGYVPRAEVDALHQAMAGVLATVNEEREDAVKREAHALTQRDRLVEWWFQLRNAVLEFLRVSPSGTAGDLEAAAAELDVALESAQLIHSIKAPVANPPRPPLGPVKEFINHVA